MIKKIGCNPCKFYEPTVNNIAKINNIEMVTIQAEDMPKNIRPEIFPFFYLKEKETILESWAGTNERKMENVLKRHIIDFKK